MWSWEAREHARTRVREREKDRGIKIAEHNKTAARRLFDVDSSLGMFFLSLASRSQPAAGCFRPKRTTFLCRRREEPGKGLLSGSFLTLITLTLCTEMKANPLHLLVLHFTPKTLWLVHEQILTLGLGPGEAYIASRFCVWGSSCYMHLSGGAGNKHREINRTAWRHRPHTVAVTHSDTPTCCYDIRQMLPKTSKRNQASRTGLFIRGCLRVTTMLISLPIYQRLTRASGTNLRMAADTQKKPCHVRRDTWNDFIF